MPYVSVESLRDRLCREGLLPRDVVVAAVGPHDRGIEAALGAGACIYDATASSA
jgi:hypothetical protein